MRDKFGRRAGSIGYRNGELEPYLVEENSATGITYICYDDGATRSVRRITEIVSGDVTTTKIEIAYGSWDNRKNLAYQPINQELA